MSRKRRFNEQPKNSRVVADTLNSFVYNDYLYRMIDICLGTYKWENLPDSVDERYLELTLLKNGSCLFFEDEVMGCVALPFTAVGRPDIYEIPVKRKVDTASGYHARRNEDDSIIIWDNLIHNIPILTLELFARRLTEISRSIDVNVSNSKTTRILPVTQDTQLTINNLTDRIDVNVPTIKIDKDLMPQDYKPIDLTTPYIADKLDIHFNVIWNQFLSWRGIENSNTDKKERLVSSEVNGNSGCIESSRKTGLKARKNACRYINEMFGLDVDVHFDSSLITALNAENLYERGDNLVEFYNQSVKRSSESESE